MQLITTSKTKNAQKILHAVYQTIFYKNEAPPTGKGDKGLINGIFYGNKNKQTRLCMSQSWTHTHSTTILVHLFSFNCLEH
jgi:hypothetical protein